MVCIAKEVSPVAKLIEPNYLQHLESGRILSFYHFFFSFLFFSFFAHPVAKLCPTLCNPTDCSPPGSSIHRISQARILEWIAFPSPGELPRPGIKPVSHAWQADSLPLSHQGSPTINRMGFCNGEHVPCNKTSDLNPEKQSNYENVTAQMQFCRSLYLPKGPRNFTVENIPNSVPSMVSWGPKKLVFS